MLKESKAKEPAKRITGGESQKPTIRPPGRRDGACDFVAGTQKADTPAVWSTPADVLPPAGANPKPISGRPKPEVFPDLVPFAYETHLAALREKLTTYMGAEPPKDFERSCLLRARGASVGQICELLDRKWAQKKFRPSGRCGPRDWNWFLTVIGNEFSSIERGRLPEAPAAADLSVSEDALARGIEAIEISDAAELPPPEIIEQPAPAAAHTETPQTPPPNQQPSRRSRPTKPECARCSDIGIIEDGSLCSCPMGQTAEAERLAHAMGRAASPTPPPLPARAITSDDVQRALVARHASTDGDGLSSVSKKRPDTERVALAVVASGT